MDKTKRERQARRRAQLDEIARRAGYKSWSAYETDILRKRAAIQKVTK